MAVANRVARDRGVRMASDSQTRWRKFRWVFHGVMLTGIVVLILLNWAKQRAAHHPIVFPVVGTVPAFTLTERSGKPMGLDTLRGQVWIADFIFTHCAGPCPLMSAQMAKLQEALKSVPDVTLVSFSVDPGRDTPAVLTEYARKFGANPTRWLFFTGDKAKIYELANRHFLVSALENTGPDRQPDEDSIIHSTMFVLVDRQARIRGHYDGTDTNRVQALVRDAQLLLREK